MPPDSPAAELDPLRTFSPAARRWFHDSFEAPTPVQQRGWPEIAAGRHSLLLAPTGSGKTLAAFFACIDRLGRLPADATPGVRVLYVSPLKALVYDIERNLRSPLVGIARTAEALEPGSFRPPRVAIRTGDTSQRDRREQARYPAEILVTTPESLYLILGSKQRETLRHVDTVIIDEVHALAASKRGAHLALSLERVSQLCGDRDPVRIGLSATATPVENVARFLGGDREVAIVDTSSRPSLDLEIRVPVPDMTRPDSTPSEARAPADSSPRALPGEEPGGSILESLFSKDAPEPAAGLWPTLYPRILDAIRAHRSTIVFVNSRGLCERLAQKLNELAGEELALSHHGSIAHDQRRSIEESLKQGRLKALVATSSLELGIDMGAVDLVLLVESPGAVSRGLQRIGRAGHQVGEVSRGILFPKHRGDLLEATVVAAGMRRGAVEALRVPRNPLDVLSQQIVAMCSLDSFRLEDLEALIRRCASFADLSREALCGVLDMLAGRYPSTDFGELRPRLLWDRESDRLEARRGAGKLALLSGGTIPDRGLYGVHLGPEGPRIGELDEEMVYETRPGEVVTLGASSWRVLEITRDRVVVQPAPGEIGRLPFWRGEGPGRPIELGRALGAFTREIGERLQGPDDPTPRRSEVEAWLREHHRLDDFAARNLVDYLVDQRDATGSLPSDRAITLERFRDELGDWRICILTPFGSRVHAPWAMAIEANLSKGAGYEVQTLWSDDGIVLRFADAEELPSRELLVPDPEEIEDLVLEQVGNSALFAGQFRENAARALLLPRRRPGSRTPLWTQRLRSQNLLAVAREFPAFPIMLETYRSCLQDVFDVPGLKEILDGVRRRTIRVDEAETQIASPFSRSLVFAYTAAYLYQGDTPVAERRAQALTLDRPMLRDLLGQEELRDLLDAAVIDETEAELQGVASEYRARHPDAIHDQLRRIGDLGPLEIEARSEGEPQEWREWLRELEATRRAIALKINGEERWVAAEDAGLYRDALGVSLPQGIPAAFVESAERPIEQLVQRYARHHGPFVTRALSDRYGVVPAQIEAILAGLESRGKLLSGDFHPRGTTREWCDPEVLRRLRRRTLARLRGEVAAVEDSVLARFLPRWHGIGSREGGQRRLDEVLEQLEGLPLSFHELENTLLPSRIPDFDPRWLDERGASGQIVWMGRGALGPRDGRVALYRRERVPLLAELPEPPEEQGELHGRLLEHLAQRGASFFTELMTAAGPGAVQKEVLGALWDLVWQGFVSNDTFAPLRALAIPTATRGHRRGRAAARSVSHTAAGRWSRVEPLFGEGADPTRRAHARALMLLDRYGVASRAVLGSETLPGGFSAVYPVYRAMEDSGKLRRGHFVEGLSGAQFAYGGVVDQLRSARVERVEPGKPVNRVEEGEGEAIVLATTDPANPFGSMLPWPPLTDGSARPRRASGGLLVLIAGEPVLLVERNGHRVSTFTPSDESRRRERLAQAIRALRSFHQRGRRGLLRVERIDGEEAAGHSDVDLWMQAGFQRDYKGLALDRFGDAQARSAPSRRS